MPGNEKPAWPLQAGGLSIKINARLVRGDSLSGWSDDVDAAAFAVEVDLAIDEGEKRVVPADADIETRMHLRSALADDDIAGDDSLAAELFHAEALAA
jgi:hypothetical protein